MENLSPPNFSKTGNPIVKIMVPFNSARQADIIPGICPSSFFGFGWGAPKIIFDQKVCSIYRTDFPKNLHTDGVQQVKKIVIFDPLFFRNLGMKNFFRPLTSPPFWDI